MIASRGLHEIFNLLGLILDHGMSLWQSVELRHCSRGTVSAVSTPIMTRCLWQEEDSHAQYKRPYETNTYGNAVGSRVWPRLGAVVNAVSGEDSDSDEELIAAGDC